MANIEELPIMISPHKGENKIEIDSIKSYQEELEKLFGKYDSIKEVREGHPNVMHLVERMREENWKAITEGSIYDHQKELMIQQEGIFFQHGIIKRGRGVSLHGEKYKLANIELINSNH